MSYTFKLDIINYTDIHNVPEICIYRNTHLLGFIVYSIKRGEFFFADYKWTKIEYGNLKYIINYVKKYGILLPDKLISLYENSIITGKIMDFNKDSFNIDNYLHKEGFQHNL
jgi:hypothetical protein